MNEWDSTYLIRQIKYGQATESKRRTFIIKLLATGFGSGYSPFASGTAGSLVAIPIYLGLWGAGKFLSSPLLSYLLSVIILMVGGFWICDQAVGIFYQRERRFIVLDKIIGFLMCMVGLAPDILLITIGFLLFRLLDVWKPLYIRKIQDLPGGLGVVLDDVACGILICVILHSIRLLWF